MTDTERYEHPALAAQLRGFLHEEATPAAPERLVFAVMDEVQRHPRRRILPGWPGRGIVSGAVRYAVLTVAIAVGVAGGIALSQSLQGPAAPSQSIPSSRPSASPAGGPVELALGGVAITASGSSVWVVTDRGILVDVAADAGVERGRIDVGLVPAAMVARANRSGRSDRFGSGDTVWLVSPGSDMLYVDAGVGGINRIPNTAGSRVTIGTTAVWVGREGAILRYDPLAPGVVDVLDVSGHGEDDPIVALGSDIWVANDTAVRRLDPDTGEATDTVPGGASALAASGDVLIAMRPDAVVAINPTTLEVLWQVEETQLTAIAGAGDRVWAISDAGATGYLLEIDRDRGEVVSRRSLPVRASSICAVAGSVWTLDVQGVVRRAGSAQ